MSTFNGKTLLKRCLHLCLSFLISCKHSSENSPLPLRWNPSHQALQGLCSFKSSGLKPYFSLHSNSQQWLTQLNHHSTVQSSTGSNSFSLSMTECTHLYSLQLYQSFSSSFVVSFFPICKSWIALHLSLWLSFLFNLYSLPLWFHSCKYYDYKMWTFSLVLSSRVLCYLFHLMRMSKVMLKLLWTK